MHTSWWGLVESRKKEGALSLLGVDMKSETSKETENEGPQECHQHPGLVAQPVWETCLHGCLLLH